MISKNSVNFLHAMIVAAEKVPVIHPKFHLLANLALNGAKVLPSPYWDEFAAFLADDPYAQGAADGLMESLGFKGVEWDGNIFQLQSQYIQEHLPDLKHDEEIWVIPVNELLQLQAMDFSFMGDLATTRIFFKGSKSAFIEGVIKIINHQAEMRP